MKLSDKIFAATCVFLMVLLIALIAFRVATAVDSYRSVSKTATVVEYSQQRFQRVIRDEGSPINVYVDTETNVMYAVRSSGSAGGICVMVDAVGNPLLWDGGTTK